MAIALDKELLYESEKKANKFLFYKTDGVCKLASGNKICKTFW